MIARILETAVVAAQAAGRIQVQGRDGPLRVEGKGVADIATAVDLACERCIVDQVRSRHPDHGLVGEEGASQAAQGEWTWVIDPLDGTKNYTHGHPRCGVSIGVLRGGQVQVAVVYAPFFDELFVATRGGGATCNGVPLQVSTTCAAGDAMVGTALTYAGHAAEPTQTQRVLRVFRVVRAVRSLGCAALDFCDVARGRYEAYFEPGLAAWDTAAGSLLVEEAGGRVTTFDGGPHAPGAPTVLASNGRLHDALVRLLEVPG